MIKRSKQIEQDIQEIKQAIEKLSTSAGTSDMGEVGSVRRLMEYMVQEREKTNSVLTGLTERLRKLEEKLNELDEEAENEELEYQPIPGKEVPLSDADSKIINFVQTKGMACADDVKSYMNYKGRNAACARLNRLKEKGLLERIQLGHKVYYKFDAGKTTNTLIISPPQ